MKDSIIPPIEYQIYLARKLGWSLSDIGKIHDPKAFYTILNEVYFQESQDEYRKMHSIASILAAIYNTIPQKPGHKALTSKDFLSGDMPTREGKRLDTNIEILAKQKGIILPSK